MSMQDAIANPEYNGSAYQRLVEAVESHAIYRIDPQGQIQSWNRGAEQATQYLAKEIVGHSWLRFFDGGDLDRELPGRLLQSAIRDGHSECECWRVRKDGHRFWTSLSLTAIRDHRGAIEGFVEVSRDLGRQRSQQAALQASEDRFRKAMHNSAVGMALIGLDGQWLQVNRAVCELLGYNSQELIGRTFQELTHPDDLDSDLSLLQDLLDGRIDSYRMEKRYVRKDGSSVWGLLSVSLVRDINGNGSPQYFISQIQDIDCIKRIERELQEQRDRLHVTLYSIGDGVITTDVDGRVEFMNPVAERMTGWRLELARQQPVEQVFHLVHAETGSRIENPVRACLGEHRINSVRPKSVLISRGGERHDIQDSAAPIRTADGFMIGAVLVFQNVTHLRKVQRELAFQTRHDPLTGLPNRRHFEDALGEASRGVRRPSGEHTLCFMDLDQFKLINDTAGHAAGDLVLRMISQTIRQGVRAGDLVARLGGDEFAIILYGCDIDHASHLMNGVGNAIAALRLPWENQVHRITASIGLTPISSDGDFVQVLMKQADIACFTAKSAGRNRVCVYSAAQQDMGSVHRDLLMAAEIRAALAQNRLVMHYQRITRLDGLAVPHYEALLRILAPDGGTVLPSHFIRAAERYDLMGEIDRWVLLDVLQLHGPQLAAIEGLQLSINLSANSLNDPRFLPFLLDLLNRSPLRPDQLIIEITETSLINNLLQAGESVRKIHALGCRIALDDFGVGLSSFNYLRTFPVDFIKIDGSFIRNLDDNPVDQAITKAINHVAHQINAHTIAEYVENQTVLAAVREIGIDYAQGHALGEAIPLASMLADCHDFNRRFPNAG